MEEWKKSLNLNNLEIIEYLNIQKIYTFCGDDKISKQIEELEENLLNEQNEIKKEKKKLWIVTDDPKLKIKELYNLFN